MPNCRRCNADNFLIKDSDGYLCFKCYNRDKPVESEMLTIIEEAVRDGLIYIDSRYQRSRRRRRE